MSHHDVSFITQTPAGLGSPLEPLFSLGLIAPLVIQAEVDDRDLPRSRPKRQTLAGRADGAALGRPGMGEAARQFRRVNGYLHLPALRVALDQTIAAVTPTKENDA